MMESNLNFSQHRDPAEALKGISVTTKTKTFLEKVKLWGQKKSLLSFPMGSGCCSMEFWSSSEGQKFNKTLKSEIEVFGPAQSDLLIISGAITYKFAPILKSIYDQMPEQKWVLAFGHCAAAGGPFLDYNVLKGASELFPVDVVVPGCPPHPQALEEGINLIYDRIESGVCASLLEPTQ